MDKKMKPRYYKKYNKHKVKYTKNKKTMKNIRKVKNNKKTQKGGRFFGFGKKKSYDTSCSSCIQYGSCSSHMKLNIPNLKKSGCKSYSNYLTKLKNAGVVNKSRSIKDLIKAISLFSEKESQVIKTLPTIIKSGVLNGKTGSEIMLNYFKNIKKFKNLKSKKRSLQIATLLGY